MKHLILAAALAVLASPVLAHPGDHHEISGWIEAGRHLLSAPFHLALIIGVLGLAFLAFKSARTTSRKKTK